MTPAQRLPWRASVGALVGLTALLALSDAPGGVTVFFLLLSAAVALSYAVMLPSAADRGESPGSRVQVDLPHQRTVDLPTTGPVVRTHSPAELRALTDEALCGLWRSSYVRLRHQRLLTHPGQGIAGIALERAGYLQEMERRHPEGFRAWLAAGARAASDPSRYLRPVRPPAPRRPEAPS